MSTTAAHAAKDCGLFKTFNKLRDAAKLQPLRLTDGLLSTSDKKLAISLERLSLKVESDLKVMRETIAKLEKRVIAVENSKKRKQSTPSEPSSSTAPAKKAKKDTAATKGTSGTSGSAKEKEKTTDSGKGKKKAGASGSKKKE